VRETADGQHAQGNASEKLQHGRATEVDEKRRDRLFRIAPTRKG